MFYKVHQHEEETLYFINICTPLQNVYQVEQWHPLAWARLYTNASFCTLLQLFVVFRTTTSILMKATYNQRGTFTFFISSQIEWKYFCCPSAILAALWKMNLTNSNKSISPTSLKHIILTYLFYQIIWFTHLIHSQSPIAFWKCAFLDKKIKFQLNLMRNEQ